MGQVTWPAATSMIFIPTYRDWRFAFLVRANQQVMANGLPSSHAPTVRMRNRMLTMHKAAQNTARSSPMPAPDNRHIMLPSPMERQQPKRSTSPSRRRTDRWIGQAATRRGCRLFRLASTLALSQARRSAWSTGHTSNCLTGRRYHNAL